jgi:hypothetical protein
LIFEAGQILSSPDINVVDNQSWQMADILDLNGDGKTDVFWRNTQGNTVIYQRNDNKIEENIYSNDMGVTWKNIH